jgi:hypothetical protein
MYFLLGILLRWVVRIWSNEILISSGLNWCKSPLSIRVTIESHFRHLHMPLILTPRGGVTKIQVNLH